MLTIKENVAKVVENFDKTNFQKLFLDQEFIRLIAVNGKEFLQALYYNGKFQFAAALIEYGMQVGVADFIHAMNKPNQTELLDHLGHIKTFISQQNYQELYNFILLSAEPVKYEEKNVCYAPYKVLCLHSVSNNQTVLDFICKGFEFLYYNGSQAIKDVINISAAHVANRKSCSFIFAHTERYAILDAVSLSEQIVYAPISKLSNLELARVIHELTHFAMEVIFNNSINPYFNGNQTNYYAFQESAKSTIVSLSKIANIEFAHPDKLLKNKSVTLSDLAIALYQDKTILKYTIPERIDDHIRVNLLFYTFFSVSERYDLQKKLVNQLFIAEVHQKNISSDGLILLERIGDLVTYPKNQHDKELIARLTELQVRNISSNMLSYLAPLEKYWLDFITPVVNKIRSNNSFICHEEEIDVTGQIVQEL